MKTLPIVFVKPDNTRNIMLHEHLRKEREKINKILFITPPEQRQNPPVLITEEENKKILETIKKINKEIFGK